MQFQLIVLATALLTMPAAGQDTPAAAKPTEHVLGTITQLDSQSHQATIKDDKAGDVQISLAEAKTLLKVPPGAKDLKAASRITVDQLAVGDRVDIRGFKSTAPAGGILARSVVLMSARDLQEAKQAQTAEWATSVPGTVTSVDSNAGTIAMNARAPQGPKPVMVKTDAQTEFTRYAVATPNQPVTSKLSDIQAGDQVRVLGDGGVETGTVTARKVYSGAFRTFNATVVKVDSTSKELTVKNLMTGKPVLLSVTDQTMLRRLPPEMAARMAQRFSGNGAAPGGAPAGPNGLPAGVPPGGGPQSGMSAGGERSFGGGPPGGFRRPGAGSPRDLSRIIERLPSFTPDELKAGSALVVSGVVAGGPESKIFAQVLVAGVEPLLQTAAGRSSSDVLGGDWGLNEMSAPQ